MRFVKINGIDSINVDTISRVKQDGAGLRVTIMGGKATYIVRLLKVEKVNG